MQPHFQKNSITLRPGSSAEVRLVGGQGLGVICRDTGVARLTIAVAPDTPKDRIVRVLGVANGAARVEARQGSVPRAVLSVRVGRQADDGDWLTRVVGNWVTAGVGAVHDAIDGIPERAQKELRKQIKKGFREVRSASSSLIDELMPESLVPEAHRRQFAAVKVHLANTIARAARENPIAEEAEEAASELVAIVAADLRDRLSIGRSLIAQRERLERGRETNPHEIRDMVARADPLLADLDELDRRTERELELKVRPKFRLKPKLVLDPSKFFIEEVLLGAGIEVKNRAGFRMKLMCEVKVREPLAFDSSTRIEGEANLKIRYGNGEVRVEYSGEIAHGRWANDALRVSAGYQLNETSPPAIERLGGLGAWRRRRPVISADFGYTGSNRFRDHSVMAGLRLRF